MVIAFNWKKACFCSTWIQGPIIVLGILLLSTLWIHFLLSQQPKQVPYTNDSVSCLPLVQLYWLPLLAVEMPEVNNKYTYIALQ
jgi:hypothetical protein